MMKGKHMMSVFHQVETIHKTQQFSKEPMEIQSMIAEIKKITRGAQQ